VNGVPNDAGLSALVCCLIALRLWGSVKVSRPGVLQFFGLSEQSRTAICAAKLH